MQRSQTDLRSLPFGTGLARIAALVVFAALAIAVSGCGNKEVHTLEATEGTRVSLDNLFYQVQLSRQLNPTDVEDSFYLEGQPAPAKGDSYFGVFIRVDNEEHDGRVLPVGIDRMQIVTAAGEAYKPIEVKGPGWGYAPAPIGRGGMLPIPDTPAYIGPIRGGLILFRIPHSSLELRPLQLEIKGNDGKTGRILVDV